MFLRSFSQMRTGTVTLSSTAVLLALPETLENDRDGGRIALEVNNVEGSGTAYIGNEDVTESTGLPIPKGETRVFPVQIGSGNKLYGVGSGDVVIAEYF